MVQTIIVQMIGLLGAACFISSYQIKSNKALFVIQMMGSALFTIQYLLLGAVTGSLGNFVAIIRNIMLCKIDKWKWVRWRGWVFVFTAIALCIMIATWQGPISILPAISLTGGTIGYWTNNAQKIRLCNMVAVSPAWLLYGILAGSIGGILNEVIVLTSIGISIRRYGWKNLGNPDFGKN